VTPRVVVYLADDGAVSVYANVPLEARIIDRHDDGQNERVIPFDKVDEPGVYSSADEEGAYTGLIHWADVGFDAPFVDRVFELPLSDQED
jgi:hypothetical protein